jgi:quercetin dioxygenase-like cupin family protein
MGDRWLDLANKESTMKLVPRRQFLHLTGALAAAAATPKSGWAQSSGGGPSLKEILRRNLEGQGQRVQETLVTVVTFPPGVVSTWHIHPGAQELVFGLEGTLILEVEGEAAKPLNVGESGLIPGDIAHAVRNESADTARILVVYSRSDKTKPLRVDVKKS